MNTKPIFTLAWKDLTDGVKNLYVVGVLVMPLILSVLFHLILQGDSRLQVVVVDPENSQFVATLRGNPQFMIIREASAETIQKEIEEHKAVGGLIVPAGFDAEVKINHQPELTAYLNGKVNTTQQNAFQQAIQNQILGLVVQPAPVKVTWISLGENMASGKDTISLKQWIWIVLVTTCVFFVGALVVPILLVEEKEKHTLEFLRLSPISMSGIVVAKALAGIAYCGVTVFILFLLNETVIQNWPLIISILLLGFILVSLLGLVIGMVCKNMMQVNTWASFVIILLMVPAFFQNPSSLSPLPFTLLHLIPTYYFVDALKMVTIGKGLIEIWVPCLALILFSFASFLGVVWMLKREKI